MKIRVINEDFSVSKINDISSIDFNDKFCFVGKTDEELSLVCSTKCVPKCTIERTDDWKAFRVEGILDFSLVGILAKISNILSNENISIFAVSTFNTDYILIKKDDFSKALLILKNNGYEIIE